MEGGGDLEEVVVIPPEYQDDVEEIVILPAAIPPNPILIQPQNPPRVLPPQTSWCKVESVLEFLYYVDLIMLWQAMGVIYLCPTFHISDKPRISGLGIEYLDGWLYHAVLIITILNASICWAFLRSLIIAVNENDTVGKEYCGDLHLVASLLNLITIVLYGVGIGVQMGGKDESAVFVLGFSIILSLVLHGFESILVYYMVFPRAENRREQGHLLAVGNRQP